MNVIETTIWQDIIIDWWLITMSYQEANQGYVLDFCYYTRHSGSVRINVVIIGSTWTQWLTVADMAIEEMVILKEEGEAEDDLKEEEEAEDDLMEEEEAEDDSMEGRVTLAIGVIIKVKDEDKTSIIMKDNSLVKAVEDNLTDGMEGGISMAGEVEEEEDILMVEEEEISMAGEVEVEDILMADVGEEEEVISMAVMDISMEEKEWISMVGEAEEEAEEEILMVGEEVTDSLTMAEEEEDTWTMRIETTFQPSILNKFNNHSFNQKQEES